MDFSGFRDGDAFQTEAAREGTFSNLFQLGSLRENDRVEIWAAVKCLLFDGLHTRRDMHLFEAGFAERHLSYFPQLIRQAYALQTITYAKCVVAYFREFGALLEDDAP